MDRAIRLLRDDKDKIQEQVATNRTKIKELEEQNICLNAKIKELDDALPKLSVTPSWPTAER